MVSINFPHPFLAKYVLCYVTHDTHFEETEWHHISARGMPMLIFPYHKPADSSFQHGTDGARYERSVVDLPAFLGSNSVFTRCHFKGDVHFVMVVMQMTGGYHFLRQSLSEFANQVCFLDDIQMSRKFEDLQDKLWEVQSGSAAVKLVDEALVAYFQKKPATVKNDFSPVSQYLMSGVPGLKVADLAKKFKCSERWIERQFSVQTGLSPKTWIRLHRFRLAASYWERNPGCSWLDIVVRFGYTDQSHLIRDFREFTGSTPVFHFEHYGQTERFLGINTPGVLIPQDQIA